MNPNFEFSKFFWYVTIIFLHKYIYNEKLGNFLVCDNYAVSLFIL
jgi:hypothetical protein